MDKIDWRAGFAEMIATFLFVFIGPGVVIVSGALIGGDLDPARLVAISFGHGIAIAVLAAATAHISGGHINPAVTFAALVTKRISVPNGVTYVAAQLVGAVIGALLLAVAVPAALGGGLGNGAGSLGTHGLGNGVTVGQGLIVEIVLTFALVFVIFAVAMDKRGAGTIAPLAIGLTVFIDHLVGVPLTGASMNPARSFGPAVAAGAWADHWIYWVGPLVGAAIAGLGYKAIFEQREAVTASR